MHQFLEINGAVLIMYAGLDTSMAPSMAQPWAIATCGAQKLSPSPKKQTLHGEDGDGVAVPPSSSPSDGPIAVTWWCNHRWIRRSAVREMLELVSATEIQGDLIHVSPVSLVS